MVYAARVQDHPAGANPLEVMLDLETVYKALYDVAREGAAPFVVMELVASRSLAELVRDGALPPRAVSAPARLYVCRR
jgi:hypothetical protein